MKKLHELHNLDGCFNTYTLKVFNIFDPKPESIDIIDIAKGLAYKPHFSGMSPYFFSIAQHCLLVVDLILKSDDVVETEAVLAGLMHDAAEAYIGDMIKPLKVHFPLFTDIEDRILGVIFKKYGIDIKYMEYIKPFDVKAQEIEFSMFYKKRTPGGNDYQYLTPECSFYEFLNMFNYLKLTDNP